MAELKEGPNEEHPEAKQAFLAALRATYSVQHAAAAASIHRATAYRWRAADEAFADAWDQALEGCKDRLEQSLFQRAVDGVEEPVFYKGKQCGSVRRYSDAAAIFLLKGGRPEKYRERAELTGPGGGPLRTESRVDGRVEMVDETAPRTAALLSLLERIGALPAVTCPSEEGGSDAHQPGGVSNPGRSTRCP